jgi:tetratricopeptide (TPR) repeat protein
VAGRFLVALAVCALTIAPALAQDGPNEQEAKQRFRHGQTLLASKRYDRAIAEFTAAYELVPRPLILFHLGRAYQAKGDLEAALDNYRRYLADEPDGKVPNEARQYIAQIEAELATREAAARARAAEEERQRAEAAAEEERQKAEATRARADALVTEAGTKLAGGDAAQAIAALEQAYALVPDVERLFDLGEAHRTAGDKERAREYYLRYTAQTPSGDHAEAARQHIGALTRELELGDATLAPTQTPERGTETPRLSERDRDGGVNWLWVGAGAAALAVGVAADLLPDTGSNGTLDATDFVPAGLYAVGAGLMFVGVF